GTESIRAQNDPAFDLVPETIVARLPVHFLKCRGGAFARTVAYAVVTREIGARFGSGDQVIRGYSVLRMRQTDFLRLASERFINADAGFNFCPNFGIQTGNEIFFGNSDSHA